jgi:hypothetical protein
MNPYYIWFVIFFCIGYLIVTDSSVARLFILLTKLAEVEYRKVKWLVVHNPMNPIVRYLMWRRSLQLAKELQEEFVKKQEKI